MKHIPGQLYLKKKLFKKGERDTHTSAFCPKMDVPTLFEHACFASSNLSLVAIQLVLFSVPWSLLVLQGPLQPAGSLLRHSRHAQFLFFLLLPLFEQSNITAPVSIFISYCFPVNFLQVNVTTIDQQRTLYRCICASRAQYILLDSAQRTILINVLKIVQSKSVLITINDV